MVCSVLREKEGKEWPLDKELAVLEIKNDVHYFYVADSIIAMPIIEKNIHKSGYEELEELALIMIAIMFAQRFPYEQSV